MERRTKIKGERGWKGLKRAERHGRRGKRTRKEGRSQLGQVIGKETKRGDGKGQAEKGESRKKTGGGRE